MADTRNGSCWDRFDRKSLLTFTGYKDRLPGVLGELDRIGMKGVNIRYNVPTPFDRVLLRHMPHTSDVARGGYFNCTMGHYFEIKTAYCLGCRSCLIMEDDIRFLKDTDEIRKTVEALPDDFDIALFDMLASNMGDCNPGILKGLRVSAKVNDRWFRYKNMRSMACYAFSRKAMERFIWLHECAATDPSIGCFRICDHFLDSRYQLPGANLYGAMENVAIQKGSPDSNSYSGDFVDIYRNMGLDLDKYAD